MAVEGQLKGSWQEEGEEGSKPDENSVFETTRNTWTTQGGGMGLYCLQAAGLQGPQGLKVLEEGQWIFPKVNFCKACTRLDFPGRLQTRLVGWGGVGAPGSTPAPPPQASKYRAYAGLGKEQRNGAADTRA